MARIKIWYRPPRRGVQCLILHNEAAAMRLIGQLQRRGFDVREERTRTRRRK